MSNGWILSPAYDINPNEYGEVLCLNITDDNNSLDLDLALEIAEYCRLTQHEAKNIIEELQKAITPSRKIATQYKISKAEQDRMKYAFRLAL